MKKSPSFWDIDAFNEIMSLHSKLEPDIMMSSALLAAEQFKKFSNDDYDSKEEIVRISLLLVGLSQGMSAERSMNILKFCVGIDKMGYKFKYEDFKSVNFEKAVYKDNNNAEEVFSLKMIKSKGVTHLTAYAKYRKKLPETFDNLEIKQMILCDSESAIKRLKQFELDTASIGANFFTNVKTN